MTSHDAMRLYCQTLIRLVQTTSPGSAAEHTLERTLNELAPLVFTPMLDAGQERMRQQALAELHAYLMGEDAQPSILA